MPTYDLPDLPPKPVWESDGPTDLLYRAPTSMEKAANGWDETVLLLSFPRSVVTDLSQGEPSLSLAVPLADRGTPIQENLPIATVDLELRSARAFVGVGGRRMHATGVESISKRPTTFVFGQRGLDWNNIDDIAVMVTAADDGGLVVLGATHGRTFWANGPYATDTRILTVEIPPPSGRELFILHTEFTPPSQAMVMGFQPSSEIAYATSVDSPADLAADWKPIAEPMGDDDDDDDVSLPPAFNQCTDDLNNDPGLDPYADGCDFMCMEHPDFGTDAYPDVHPVIEYGRPFAIFADANWCTAHAETWEDDLIAIGLHAETMLNWVNVGSPRVPPFRHVGVWCDCFEDLDQAADCHNNGVCPAALAGYPLKGVANFWGEAEDDFTWPTEIPNTFLHRVWDISERWASLSDPEDVHPIQQAVVLTPLVDVTDINAKLVGRALIEPHLGFAGGALVRTTKAGGDEKSHLSLGYAVAHELGHTQGLAHDNSQEGEAKSFMNFSGGGAPILGEDVDSHVWKNTSVKFSNVEVWELLAPVKKSPRSPGFKYVGCDDMSNPCPEGMKCVGVQTGANKPGGEQCVPL